MPLEIATQHQGGQMQCHAAATADHGCQLKHGEGQERIGKGASEGGAVRTKPAARPPRVRETTLGPVDWKKVDPLALSMADRKADSDARYHRKPLNADETQDMKQKWQHRQLKRVSDAALLFGPRQSMKHLFEHESEDEDGDVAVPLQRTTTVSSGSTFSSMASTSSPGVFSRPAGSVSGNSMVSQGSTVVAAAGARKTGAVGKITSLWKAATGRPKRSSVAFSFIQQMEVKAARESGLNGNNSV